MRRQFGPQPLLRQHRKRLRIRQHIGEPFRRMARIERDISAAGLQDAQHAHNHLERALQEQRHQDIGSDTQGAQLAG